MKESLYEFVQKSLKKYLVESLNKVMKELQENFLHEEIFRRNPERISEATDGGITGTTLRLLCKWNSWSHFWRGKVHKLRHALRRLGFWKVLQPILKFQRMSHTKSVKKWGRGLRMNVFVWPNLWIFSEINGAFLGGSI